MITKLKCLKIALATLSASLCLAAITISGSTADSSYSITASAADNIYVPRLTAPSESSKYYTSDNPFYKAGYGMPNCTCYAWGRAYELLGKKPNLCEGNADTWYSYNKSGKYYSYGQEPKLGAIACWSGQHVAVVEEIKGNTLTLSHSSWGGPYFATITVDKNNMENVTSGFQGYIYIGDWEDESSKTKGHVMTESEAGGNSIPDGEYWIGSRLQSGYFLDPAGSKAPAAEGANVQMYNFSTCAPNAQDTWKLEYLDNGFYRIVQKDTDMCLTVKDNSVYTDAAIVMSTKNDKTGQQWSVERNGKDGFTIQSRSNGGYLDVKGGSKASGTLLQTSDTCKETSQAWNFVPSGSSVFKGKGTESDPYQISSVKDLRSMATLINDDVSAPSYYDKYYIQTADIDLDGISFTPIGTRYASNAGMGFNGVYNGNKHVIRGLYVERQEDYNGLFGWTHGGIITDLAVFGDINCPESTRVGGIVGSIGSPDARYIKNCSFTGTVKGKLYVGGIAGEMWAAGTIDSCYFNGNITESSGKGCSGGIVGYISHGWEDNTYKVTVRNCYAVSGSTDLTGGIIGYFETITPGETLISRNYYLKTMASQGVTGDYTDGCKPLSEVMLRNADSAMSSPYRHNSNPIFNDGYPIFDWQETESEQMGDVDEDGIVTENDMILLKNWLLNIVYEEKANSSNADINGDGKVNVIDQIILKRILDCKK